MAKPFEDRFFLIRLTRDERMVKFALLGIVLLLLLLFINTLYLTFFSQKSSISPQQTNPTPTQTQSVTISPTNSVVIPTTVPAQQQVQQNGGINTNSWSAVKEYFISLGSGSSTAQDWTDVPGLTAQIDFGSYSNIKEIHFEASVGIPTANENASVRLFNVTDKHPVWYSEITLTNGQFVSSNPIIYDTGSKTYQVQMKTSLQFLANLIQSRLHIVLQ